MKGLLDDFNTTKDRYKEDEYHTPVPSLLSVLSRRFVIVIASRRRVFAGRVRFMIYVATLILTLIDAGPTRSICGLGVLSIMSLKIGATRCVAGDTLQRVEDFFI